MHSRSAIAVLALSAALALPAAAPAKPAAKSVYRSCPSVKVKGDTIGIHVKAKGVSCTMAKKVLTNLLADKPSHSASLNAFSKTCKTDKNQKAAGKKLLVAVTCSSGGTRVVKAWIKAH